MAALFHCVCARSSQELNAHDKYDNLVHATDLLQIVFVTNDLHSRLNQLAAPIAPLHHVSVDLTDEAICSISNVHFHTYQLEHD